MNDRETIDVGGWCVPVGVPGGVWWGVEQVPDGGGVVRLGDELRGLDPPLYRMWRAAGAAPTAEQLGDWSVGAGIGDWEPRLAWLIDEGLVLEGSPNGDTQAKIGRLVAHLTGDCVGNSPEQPASILLVGRDGARVQVDAYLFEVLVRSDGASAIADVCARLDQAMPLAGERSYVTHLAEGLPALVSSGVLRLDAAQGR